MIKRGSFGSNAYYFINTEGICHLHRCTITVSLLHKKMKIYLFIQSIFTSFLNFVFVVKTEFEIRNINNASHFFYRLVLHVLCKYAFLECSFNKTCSPVERKK